MVALMILDGSEKLLILKVVGFYFYSTFTV